MELKPVQKPVKSEEQIANEIMRVIFRIYFAPIIEAIRDPLVTKKLLNSNSILIDAIKSYKIQYYDNKFHGPFNAAISKELSGMGAVFNKPTKTYSLDYNSLSPDVQSAIAMAALNTKKIKERMIDALDTINTGIELDNVNFNQQYDQLLSSIDRQLSTDSKHIMELKIKLTDKQKQTIATDYTNNLNLYIKSFLDEEIPKFRELLQDNIFAGYRPEYLKKIIRERYNVSENKAKFLAFQETNLLTSKYTQSRYEDAGIRKYKWSTSHDSRVRHDHEELNGKIFQFNNPPIVNQETGKRANPGEDFGCRCKAIPVLD